MKQRRPDHNKNGGGASEKSFEFDKSITENPISNFHKKKRSLIVVRKNFIDKDGKLLKKVIVDGEDVYQICAPMESKKKSTSFA